MAWVEVGVHKLSLVATESFPLTLGYKLATGKKRKKSWQCLCVFVFNSGAGRGGIPDNSYQLSQNDWVTRSVMKNWGWSFLAAKNDIIHYGSVDHTLRCLKCLPHSSVTLTIWYISVFDLQHYKGLGLLHSLQQCHYLSGPLVRWSFSCHRTYLFMYERDRLRTQLFNIYCTYNAWQCNGWIKNPELKKKVTAAISQGNSFMWCLCLT